MVGAPHAKSVERDLVERPQPVRQAAGTCFMWSPSKIRIACLVLFGAATLAAASFAVSVSFIKWLSLAWLVGVALLITVSAGVLPLIRSCSRLISAGIFDRRLMSRPIEWQEIEAICPINADRSHVVDIKLRWPKITLGEARWPVRIGAYCQTMYGVPAVTISMLLIEGNASEMLDAVAQYRPDLLHYTNRRALLSTHR